MTTLSPENDWVEVECGVEHTLATTGGGQLYAWGGNTYVSVLLELAKGLAVGGPRGVYVRSARPIAEKLNQPPRREKIVNSCGSEEKMTLETESWRGANEMCST